MAYVDKHWRRSTPGCAHRWTENGETSEGSRVLILGVKDGIATSESWGTVPDKYSMSSSRGTRCNGDGAWPLTKAEVAAAERLRLLNPMALLAARNDKGFVAQDVGAGDVGGTNMPRVLCWHKGQAVTLAFDPDSHRVAAAVWHDGGR